MLVYTMSDRKMKKTTMKPEKKPLGKAFMKPEKKPVRKTCMKPGKERVKPVGKTKGIKKSKLIHIRCVDKWFGKRQTVYDIEGIDRKQLSVMAPKLNDLANLHSDGFIDIGRQRGITISSEYFKWLLVANGAMYVNPKKCNWFKRKDKMRFFIDYLLQAYGFSGLVEMTAIAKLYGSIGLMENINFRLALLFAMVKGTKKSTMKQFILSGMRRRPIHTKGKLIDHWNKLISNLK